MSEPNKPVLTEEVAIDIWNEAQARAPATFIKLLRERGLIAPEPVDPLLIEATEIVGRRIDLSSSTAKPIQNHWAIQCTKEGIERGMELEREKRPVLTREMVRAALKSSLELTDTPIEYGDFGFRETHNYRRNIETVAKRLHTALQEQLNAQR